MLTVPISPHLTEVSCSVRLLLLWPASFPDFPTCVGRLEKSALFHLEWLFKAKLPESPFNVSAGIASFWFILADEAPFRHSYGSHCCLPAIVKLFGLAPYFVSSEFPGSRNFRFFSAVRLNLLKNTLRWIAFYSYRWFAPLLAGFGSLNRQVALFDRIGVTIKLRFSSPCFLSCLLSLTWFNKYRVKMSKLQVFFGEEIHVF